MARGLHHDLERLASAERAAQIAGEAVARWWKQIAESPQADLPLDTLFKEALFIIRTSLGADAVALLLADASGQELIARAAVGLTEEVSPLMRIHVGEGMSGRVLASRDRLIIGDLCAIQIVNPVLRHSGLRSIVAVPLVSGDRVLGVIWGGSYALQRFDSEDAEFMELVGGRLAGALERVRLFENESGARQSAERALEQLQRMQRITSLLAAAVDSREVASSLAEEFTHTSGEQSADCRLWLVKDNELCALAATNESDEDLDLPKLPLSANSLLARSVRSRRPFFAPDASALEDSGEPWGLGTAGYSSLAIVPVQLGDMCIGAMSLCYRQPHQFGPEEVGFLQAVMAQVAQALERARLYSEQQRSADVASFFARAAKVTAEGTDLEDTLRRLGSLALEAAGDICLLDVVEQDGGFKRVAALHKDPARQHLVDLLRSDYPPDPSGDHPSMVVMRTGEVMWGTTMPDDFLRSTTRDEKHYQLTKTLGFRSYLCVPLSSYHEVLGTMTLVSTSRRFDGNDVSFADALAKQVAAVVDNARRFDATSRVSQILQASLLPQEIPAVPGLEIHAVYLPATRGLEIGGDFYDVLDLDNSTVWFTVGDVAGHDSAAAAIMGHLRSATRTLTAQVTSPAELISALQSSWSSLGFRRIATAAFGVLDPKSGEVVMSSAGHYPPLLIGPGGHRYLDVEPSPPLGVRHGDVPEWRGKLDEGSVLLLYTDGAIDERVLGSEKSMQRLAETAAEGPLSASQVCRRVVDGLDLERIDDIALLSIERLAGLRRRH